MDVFSYPYKNTACNTVYMMPILFEILLLSVFSGVNRYSKLVLLLDFSTQVGSQPITSVAWLPMLRILVTVTKDGNLQVWKTRVIINPNRPPMQANFFEPSG